MSDVAMFFTPSPLLISFSLHIPCRHFINQTGPVSYFLDTIQASENVLLGVIMQCFLQTLCDQSYPETPRRKKFYAHVYLQRIGLLEACFGTGYHL